MQTKNINKNPRILNSAELLQSTFLNIFFIFPIFWYFCVRKVSVIVLSHANIFVSPQFVCIVISILISACRSFVSCITMKYKEQKTNMYSRVNYFEVMLTLDIFFCWNFGKKSSFIFGCKYETWFSFEKLFYFSVI